MHAADSSGAVRRALIVNAVAKSATISIVASTTVYAVRSPTQHLACEATTHFPELHSSTIITWPCRGFVTSSAMSHAKYSVPKANVACGGTCAARWL